MLGARGPDLLAVDDVVVAAALGERADARRVGAGIGLHPQVGADDRLDPLGPTSPIELDRAKQIAQVGDGQGHLPVLRGSAGGFIDCCPSDDLPEPGDYVTYDNAGRSYLLARQEDGIAYVS